MNNGIEEHTNKPNEAKARANGRLVEWLMKVYNWKATDSHSQC